MSIFVARIAPYSIVLFCALLALKRWCAWRHRFARRYRAAVSHAMRWTPAPVLAVIPMLRSQR
jgi:hypothetical protein